MPEGRRGLKVLLYQLDGKMPNIALMRLAHHHRQQGHEVELRKTGNPHRLLVDAADPPTRVYGSLIFERTRPVARKLREAFPQAILGGTGLHAATSLEDLGISTTDQDYSIYPDWKPSIGFTQRGCRLKCGFCVVPKKEGAIHQVATVDQIWRGAPWPRQLILLDNDFFGQAGWQRHITTMIAGGFQVNFNQGINARFLDDEAAAAIASVDYRNWRMTSRQIHTAWDNRKDEARLFAGLQRLVDHGVKPRHIMVYMLVGYWPWENEADRLYRVEQLRAFGAVPYPMPFQRTRELVGFQRWVAAAYDKRIPWSDWKKANYRPEKLGNA
jgi:hypothetical protein